MDEKRSYEYLVQIVIFIFFLIFSLLFIKPVITIILTSIVLTYVSYPIYKFLIKKKWRHFPAGLITILILAVILSLPFAYIVFAAAYQSQTLFTKIENIPQNASIYCEACNASIKFFEPFITEDTFQRYVQEGIDKLVSALTNYLILIPKAILGTGISLFLTYFLYRDGTKLLNRIAGWLPLERNIIDSMIFTFKQKTKTIVFGELAIAFIQGLVATLGYMLFGVPLAIFWGVITSFLALLPVIGAVTAWLSISVYLFIHGYITGDTYEVFRGGGLFLYGAFIISTIDNIIRVKLGERYAKTNPVIIIVGVIGGIALFGILGIMLGPIVLCILITYFDHFKESLKK